MATGPLLPGPFCYIGQYMGKTLLKKVWDLHAVRALPTGQTQLFVGLHLIHAVSYTHLTLPTILLV